MTNREKLISMLVAMLDGKSDKELERIIDLVREYLGQHRTKSTD